MTNNTTNPLDWDKQESQIPSVAFVLIVGTASVSIIVSLIFTVISTRILKKTFHNLFVICLCANDGILGLVGLVFFLTSNLIHNSALCRIILIALTYCVNCSFIIIFLVAFIRYQNFVKHNLHMCLVFERFKYKIIAGAHILAIVIAVGSTLWKPLDNVMIEVRCSAIHFYKETYFIVVVTGYSLPTILTIAVSYMYAVLCYRVWRDMHKIAPENIDIQTIKQSEMPSNESAVLQISDRERDKTTCNVVNSSHSRRERISGSSTAHGRACTSHNQEERMPGPWSSHSAEGSGHDQEGENPGPSTVDGGACTSPHKEERMPGPSPAYDGACINYDGEERMSGQSTAERKINAQEERIPCPLLTQGRSSSSSLVSLKMNNPQTMMRVLDKSGVGQKI